MKSDNPFYKRMGPASDPNYTRAVYMLYNQIDTVTDLLRFWKLYDGI